MELNSCRIHKGKLVRMLKCACEGAEVIMCNTPNCINNDVENSECKLPQISVQKEVCNDFVDRSSMAQPIAKKSISIKRIAADEKKEDIVIETPESKSADIKSPADESTDVLPEEEVKDMASIKSEVWTSTLEKTVEEAIDVDAAADQWFKNMKDELGKKLADEKISESDYDIMLSDLEDMKENGVLADTIKNKILEQSSDIVEEETEPTKEKIEETPADEKKEEKPAEDKKEEPKKDEGKDKKKKEELPELPGLDLE